MSDKKFPSRVSITYSVDTQEVPSRVKILMNELANSFGGVAKLAREAGTMAEEDTVQAIKDLTELSILIAKTNIRVDDCVEILAGYLQLLMAAAEEQEEAPKAKAKKKAKKKTAKKTTKKAPKKKED